MCVSVCLCVRACVRACMRGRSVVCTFIYCMFRYVLSERFCGVLGIEKTEKHLPELPATTVVSTSFAPSGPSRLPRSTYNERDRSMQQHATRNWQGSSQFAPSQRDQSSAQRQHIASLTSQTSASGNASGTSRPNAGRGAGRGSTHYTPPTGGTSVGPATRQPGMLASGQTRPPTMASREPLSSPPHSTSGASLAGHSGWPSSGQFPAEDVRELEYGMAMASMSPPHATAISSSDNIGSGDSDDTEWQVAGSRKGGRGRGFRTGPQQPLRRPRDIQVPRFS